MEPYANRLCKLRFIFIYHNYESYLDGVLVDENKFGAKIYIQF